MLPLHLHGWNNGCSEEDPVLQTRHISKDRTLDRT
jgi:hypothetical protein